MDSANATYILAIVVAWLVAHLIKLVLSFALKDDIGQKNFFRSGGMPSAHSATMVSVSVAIGLGEGFNSAVFALAAAVSLIVIHDAVRVRHATGENGSVISHLINELKSKVVAPRIVRGHTVAEVVVGAILGAVIGAVVFLATY